MLVSLTVPAKDIVQEHNYAPGRKKPHKGMVYCTYIEWQSAVIYFTCLYVTIITSVKCDIKNASVIFT